MSTQSGHKTATRQPEADPVVIDDHDAVAIDREMARTAAAGLGIWLALTFTAVGLLLVFGDPISSVFV
ncbi:hypothetical protein D8Y22_19045 [Salinadaptatus halalkaliphilus]|uniref:Uncharacterized protein n=1 Tax=Salinadaptatus halalkaliphilus TaxID=2419781 RepID=A0A4S3THA9_9EURY|nr:hypothetical protein [Salinadaptatus halalkaliphilus]THE63262.1 hypothetical protein D8Y22_19045 [Salinadaptatus halalkaliphilus]